MTNGLLESFEKSDSFNQYQAQWKKRGKEINTAKDLISCYYHDFKVISIPQCAKTPSTAMDVRLKVQKLYGEIDKLSACVNGARKENNMELDITTFNSYFERSVQILARDYRSSIDFQSFSKDNNPIPRKLSEHLTLLLRNLAKTRRLELSQEPDGERKLVADVIPYLACCIVSQEAVTPTNGRYLADHFHKFTSTADISFLFRYSRLQQCRGR